MPPTPRMSVLAAWLLALGLAGCAAPAPPPDRVVFHEALPPDWTPPEPPEAAAPEPVQPAPAAETWGPRTSRYAGAVGRGLATGAVVVGRGVATGASGAGRSLGTAYRGVRQGFQEPAGDASYGPYPREYADLVRKYFLHVLDYPATVRLKLDRPVQGYMNQGLFQGGGVAWQGWIVDVQVEQVGGWGRREPLVERFAVRIRDDFVIDVHRDRSVLHRLTGSPRPAALPAAPR